MPIKENAMQSFIVRTLKEGKVEEHRCEAISLHAAKLMQKLCEREGHYKVLEVKPEKEN
jgi:hypothetical protein